MPYRPRELVVRAREAATLLLAALDRNEMVATLSRYVRGGISPPGRADQPDILPRTAPNDSPGSNSGDGHCALSRRCRRGLKVSVNVRATKRPTKQKKERKVRSRSKEKGRPWSWRFPFSICFARNFLSRWGSGSTGLTKTPRNSGATLDFTRSSARLTARRARVNAHDQRVGLGTFRRSSGAAARSFAHGSGAAGSREISDGTEYRRRSRAAESLFSPPRATRS